MTKKVNRLLRQLLALIINPTISFCRLLASDHVKLVLHVLSKPLATEGNPKIKKTARSNKSNIHRNNSKGKVQGLTGTALAAVQSGDAPGINGRPRWVLCQVRGHWLHRLTRAVDGITKERR